MKFSSPGLSDQQVAESRAKFGSNIITPQETETFWDKLKDNIQDPTIIILLVALVLITILAIFGYAKWYEGIGIAFAVVIATGVSTWSEHKNENAFQQLLDEASRIQVKVFRNGKSEQISIDDLVKGDIVLLQPGDKVPADGVLIAGTVQIDQASLTGESDQVEKTILPAGQIRTKKPDLHNSHYVFRGSVVTDNEAIVELVAVGDDTVYGQLAKGLRGAERDSPLKVKLKDLADSIGKFGTIGAVLIAIVYIFEKLFIERGLNLSTVGAYLTAWANLPQLLSDLVTALILAVVVIVMAVPEGLPMMVAIVLSTNMRKLLKDKVLVRKLLGIEAAGSLNVLFSDKTGTLTKGELQVSALLNGEHVPYSSFDAIPTSLRRLLSIALKYNTIAVLDTSDLTAVKIVGADRTERALLKYIEPALRSTEDIEVTETIAFNAERKFSATRIKGAENMTLVKGAPEFLLKHCTHYWDNAGVQREFTDLAALNVELDILAGRSMRLLAVATTDTVLDHTQKTLPAPLTLIAIIGLRDELREESHAAVLRAQQAGIQVVMITGDRKDTATAIAQEVGMFNRPDTIALTSADIESMTDAQLKNVLPHLRVISRAYPHTKSRLVQLSQELGLVVGMTGDGVNDAAALKRADVGFAMGSGTEVAKEAGDIVVLDDNFSSITRAILYGRTLFKSIRKFLVFQLTVSLSAILVAFFGPFFGFDLPLTMVQMLWINIIMDSLAALALSGEAALDRYMVEPPIPRNDPIVTCDMWASVLFNGISISIFSLIFLTNPMVKQLFPDHYGPNDALLTAFFAFFVFIHMFNTFNARTERLRLFEHILENRGFLPVLSLIFAMQIIFTYIGGGVLRTVWLTANEWLYIVGLALIIIPLDLLRKQVRNAMGFNPGPCGKLSRAKTK
jgi:calcium-translocating P-type ATPase